MDEQTANLTLALREREARLNEAQRLAQVGSWELDPATGQLAWSDEMYRIFELDKPAARPCFEALIAAVHPQDRDLVIRAHAELVTHNTPFTITHRLQMSDGRIKHVRERGEPHFDSEGKLIRAAGTAQDVTEGVDADSRLRASNELLSAIFESSHTLVACLDTDMNFVRVNRAYAAADGKSPEYFIGKNHFELYPNQENEAIFRRVVATGEPFSVMAKPFEYELNPERGVTHWDWTLTPIRDSNGAIAGVVLALLDVTERINIMKGWMQAKHELSVLNDSLELRVADRTAELIQTKNEAERANRAKTEFLSRMSHELRTPLNAILGFAQLLRLQPLDAASRSYVAEILGASEHLMGFIDKLLDLSRIESGRVDLAVATVGSTGGAERATNVATKVVYIEDNVANLRLMQQIFRAHLEEVELLSASAALEGIQLVREHQPKLVLMDINLPGLSGYQALDELRASPQTQGIPVIALSADAMPHDVERGLQAGFHGYVTKPLNIKELIGTLAGYLER